MRIDHLVWYSADLAAGEARFARALGTAPTYGGVHPGEGTRNSLLAVGAETYVEILGRDPAEESAKTLDSELAGLRGQGLYHWAIGGIDLRALHTRARGIEIVTSDVVAGGRAKPDGSWLGWKLVGLRDHGFGALLPFFIDLSGGAHPAASAPHGGELERFELLSPRARDLAAVCQALGLDVTIAEASRPAIVATIRGRHQTLKLESFDPLPRGFVI